MVVINKDGACVAPGTPTFYVSSEDMYKLMSSQEIRDKILLELKKKSICVDTIGILHSDYYDSVTRPKTNVSVSEGELIYYEEV